MDLIRRRAFEGAARDAGLALLAVMLAVAFRAEGPLSALQAAAAGLTMVALFMLVRALGAGRRDLEAEEIWINLKRDERPPRRVAQPLIARAAREAFATVGLYAAGTAVTLWGLGLGALALGLA